MTGPVNPTLTVMTCWVYANLHFGSSWTLFSNLLAPLKLSPNLKFLFASEEKPYSSKEKCINHANNFLEQIIWCRMENLIEISLSLEWDTNQQGWSTSPIYASLFSCRNHDEISVSWSTLKWFSHFSNNSLPAIVQRYKDMDNGNSALRKSSAFQERLENFIVIPSVSEKSTPLLVKQRKKMVRHWKILIWWLHLLIFNLSSNTLHLKISHLTLEMQVHKVKS